MPNLPTGVWAIASGLKSYAEVVEFSRSSQAAACWCWRRPQMNGSDQLRALQLLNQSKKVLTHGMADWAQASAAAGVICGANSLDPVRAKQLYPRLLIGASVHNSAEVSQAISEQVDFLVYGPVYDTPSKQSYLSARGLDKLAEVVATKTKVIAIGGVQTTDQVRQLKEVGVHAVAVLRAAHDFELMSELSAAFATG